MGWAESTLKPQSIRSCCTCPWENYPAASWPGNEFGVHSSEVKVRVMSHSITTPDRFHAGEMFGKTDPSYPCSDPSSCHAKPVSVSASSVPVARDASSFTVCSLAMQSRCQRLSHFPEYGRLSQAELSLSVTQPMTIAKLAKSLRKIATCFGTSSGQDARGGGCGPAAPDTARIWGNTAHPRSRSDGSRQGLLVTPPGDEWGKAPVLDPRDGNLSLPARAQKPREVASIRDSQMFLILYHLRSLHL